jgi:hypothetical protein
VKKREHTTTRRTHKTENKQRHKTWHPLRKQHPSVCVSNKNNDNESREREREELRVIHQQQNTKHQKIQPQTQKRKTQHSPAIWGSGSPRNHERPKTPETAVRYRSRCGRWRCWLIANKTQVRASSFTTLVGLAGPREQGKQQRHSTSGAQVDHSIVQTQLARHCKDKWPQFINAFVTSKSCGASLIKPLTCLLAADLAASSRFRSAWNCVREGLRQHAHP